MEYSFTALGHKNITARHKRTLEFTKDKEVSLQGDCILGVSADFKGSILKELVKKSHDLKMEIKAGGVSDSITFEANPDFDDEKEIVVRTTDFNSKRTLGLKADKACNSLKKELIEILKNPKEKIHVSITGI
ncbi:DUF371 domain-containing protein [Candidatus Woesearchaeota archaeon]|nr:DUF371 domain-containing protein [Candidatus Woesearchaeota archaeon]